MNLLELINEVNKDLDDALPSADITGWINRGLGELSPHANYIKSTTISVIADQKTYSKPADFINAIEIVDESMPQRYLEQPINDFTSMGYKVIGSDIVIQPKPTVAITLTLYYMARLPQLVADTDVPVIRPDFHDLLVLYAVAKARYQDEEESLHQTAMSEYLSRRQQFIYENHRNPMYSIELIY